MCAGLSYLMLILSLFDCIRYQVSGILIYTGEPLAKGCMLLVAHRKEKEKRYMQKLNADTKVIESVCTKEF